MPSLSRRIRSFFTEKALINWRYKLTALAAAFIIWAYVAGQQSMQAVYTVPVYFQNLPADRVLVNTKVQKIQVTISGRRDRILSLKERQIWVAIELSGLKLGRNVYRLTKHDIVVPAGIEAKNFSPRKIVLRLKKAQKTKEELEKEAKEEKIRKEKEEKERKAKEEKAKKEREELEKKEREKKEKEEREKKEKEERKKKAEQEKAKREKEKKSKQDKKAQQ